MTDPTPHPYGFRRFAEADPTKLALVDPVGRRWTRGALLEEADRLANALRAQGLSKGDVVAVMAPNGAEFLALSLAVTQTGLVLTPINYRLAAEEAAYVLEDCGAKAVFLHERAAEPGKAALAQLSRPPALQVGIGAVEGLAPYETLVREAASDPPPPSVAGLVMNYTSGTTGRPRAVLRQLADVPATDYLLHLIKEVRASYGQEPEQGIFYCGSPLYHTAPLNWTSIALHLGHPVVLVDKWEPEAMLRLVEAERVTWTHMVPTQFVRLLKLPEAVRSRYDLSSLSCVIHAAAPCPIPVKRAMFDWLGPIIWEYYGATEGGGTMAPPGDWLAHPGTVGRPTPGADIRILDDAGQPLGPREIGTVYMLTRKVYAFEYKGDAEKTKAALRGDYFTVGDVGYLDEGGFLYLCDRKSDMIISGGANIYPAEIEAVLLQHPQVLDAAVFGIPDEEWGESVKAVLQLRPGVTPSEALTANIRGFLEPRLARMKHPKSIDFTDALPRDENGKLYKRRLRDPYWQGRDRKI